MGEKTSLFAALGLASILLFSGVAFAVQSHPWADIDTSGNLGIGIAAAAAKLHIKGNFLVESTAGIVGLVQDSFGNIGIGTTAPQSKLHVSGNLQVGGANGVALTQDGKVGIGTNAPSSALDVKGQIKGSSLDVSGQVKGSSLDVSGQVKSGSSICIGSECRDKWPSSFAEPDLSRAPRDGELIASGYLAPGPSQSSYRIMPAGYVSSPLSPNVKGVWALTSDDSSYYYYGSTFGNIRNFRGVKYTVKGFYQAQSEATIDTHAPFGIGVMFHGTYLAGLAGILGHPSESSRRSYATTAVIIDEGGNVRYYNNAQSQDSSYVDSGQDVNFKNGFSWELIIENPRVDRDSDYAITIKINGNTILNRVRNPSTQTSSYVTPVLMINQYGMASGITYRYEKSSLPAPNVPSGGKIMFVTRAKYNGNLGGLSGADSKCQSEAESAGLSGTYNALLSTSSVNGKDRISNCNFYNVGGDKISDNCGNQATYDSNQQRYIYGLWSGQISNPPKYSADGYDFSQYGGSNTWTATQTNGEKYSTYHCDNWASSSTSAYGGYGFPYTTYYYSGWYLLYSILQCDQKASLVCVQT